MLKKKGGVGFKPKAPVRRNAAGPSSQGPERQPSKTPAPPSASRQPTPASALSQDPVAHPSTSHADSSSQIATTDVAVDTASTVAVLEEPATAPPGPRDSQTTQTAVHPTTSPNAAEGVSRVAENENATNESDPTENTDKSKKPAASVGASILTSSSSRNDAETVISQPPESATPTHNVTETPTTEPTRSSRRTAAHRIPLPTAAPNASAGVSEPSTSSTAGQVPTPASSTPQPAEPAQQDVTSVPTASPTRQAATPPIESHMDIQESIEATGDAEDNEPPQAPPKAKRAPRKRKPAAEPAEVDGEAAPAPKKPRKKKAAAPAPEGENATEGEGEGSQPPAAKKRARKSRAQSSQSVGDGAETSTSSKKGGFRHRSPTPEDAEEQEVDQRQVKMGDLVKDLRIGKKFSRHDELLERQRMKKLKAKMGSAAANDNEGGGGGGGSAAGSKVGTPVPSQENGESSSAAPKPLADGAPQFQIIDGQIVVNQSTLQFDRHAAAAREAGDLEEEIEDDFTHHTTSNTYMKKIQKPNHWTDIETETFYRGLRMWGTDFALLCKMFPGKNRRHIKLKFNREERAHPAKVNAALVGEKQVSIDLEEYKSHTGLEYKSVDEIEAEQARVEEEFEAEQRRAEEEAAEEARRKKEELFGKKEEVEKKGRARGRRKKDAGGFGLGG